MEKIIKQISSFLGVLATLATLILMVAIAADVFFRTTYGSSVPGILELSETALVAAVFLGLAYTGATNSHIGVDLLTERLPAHIARWVIFTAWALSSIFLGWLFWATLDRAIESTDRMEARTGLINWPLWPSRWMIVVGVLAMLVVALMNTIRTARGDEVLGVDPAMPDVVEHPYEYVTEGDTDEALTEAQALAIAKMAERREAADAQDDAQPETSEGGSK